MFDQLFVRSDALTRYLSAPLVDERRQYLTHCAVQGMTKSTLEAKARLLLSIAEYLKLADRPSDTITLSEIKKAATRWSNHNWLVRGSIAQHKIVTLHDDALPHEVRVVLGIEPSE